LLRDPSHQHRRHTHHASNAATFFVAALYLATCRPALAQAPVVLQIDIENLVEYQTDTMDTSRYGTNPDITPSAGILRFAPAIAIGDIVAVNGEPAKGTFAAGRGTSHQGRS
jgi:hypothetical protein